MRQFLALTLGCSSPPDHTGEDYISIPILCVGCFFGLIIAFAGFQREFRQNTGQIRSTPDQEKLNKRIQYAGGAIFGLCTGSIIRQELELVNYITPGPTCTS